MPERPKPELPERYRTVANTARHLIELIQEKRETGHMYRHAARTRWAESVFHFTYDDQIGDPPEADFAKLYTDIPEGPSIKILETIDDEPVAAVHLNLETAQGDFWLIRRQGSTIRLVSTQTDSEEPSQPFRKFVTGFKASL